jgi:hypothetical protein
MSAFRDGAGPGVDLMLDLNSPQDRGVAADRARRLEALGLTWLEIDNMMPRRSPGSPAGAHSDASCRRCTNAATGAENQSVDWRLSMWSGTAWRTDQDRVSGL